MIERNSNGNSEKRLTWNSNQEICQLGFRRNGVKTAENEGTNLGELCKGVSHQLRNFEDGTNDQTRARTTIDNEKVIINVFVCPLTFSFSHSLFLSLTLSLSLSLSLNTTVYSSLSSINQVDSIFIVGFSFLYEC